MKTIGRFIFRGHDENDGLILGASFKSHDFFKANTVYEIVDVFGDVTIREIGEAILTRAGEKPSESPCAQTWGSTVDQLLNELGPDLILTRKEYAQILYGRHREMLIKQYGEDSVVEWELEGKDLNDIRY